MYKPYNQLYKIFSTRLSENTKYILLVSVIYALPLVCDGNKVKS